MGLNQNIKAIMAVKSTLTVKQQKFIQHIVEGKSQSESYALAGYSIKNRNSQDAMASTLLRNAKVSAAIQKGRDKLAKKHEIKSEQIINELKGIGLSNLTDVVNWDEAGELKITASEDLPDSVKAGIKKIKSKKTIYYNKSGDNTHDTIDIEFEMHNKVPALEKLGVYKGLWKDEKGDTLVLNQFLTSIQNHLGMVEPQ